MHLCIVFIVCLYLLGLLMSKYLGQVWLYITVWPTPHPPTHLYACPIPWPKLYQVLSTFLFLWYLSMEVVRCCWPFLCLARLRWMDGSCLLVPVTVLSFVFCIQQIIEHSNSSNPYPSELNKHRKNVYISYIPTVAWNRRRCFIYGHNYT